MQTHLGVMEVNPCYSKVNERPWSFLPPPPLPPCLERQKRYYLLPEREMKHIERYIHRGEQVREFKSKTFKQLPQHSSEIKFPRIVPEEHGIQNTQRRKQVYKREQMQIKDHQERMLRGRELVEQKLKEGILRKDQSQPPAREKCESIKSIKKEIKEYESVTAYPLFQPCNSSQIKVNVLMEKSQNREENNTITKPLQRRFLTMPPFLRSQIGKIKDLVLS
uniref:Uncharacterized protein n=1 Tax=Moschus moschiferus TaxID=68415 RepID=A0A8C6D0A1_MOSMO